MKLPTYVLVVLIVAAILLPGESAVMYALKGLVFMSCALILVRKSSGMRTPSVGSASTSTSASESERGGSRTDVA